MTAALVAQGRAYKGLDSILRGFPIPYYDRDPLAHRADISASVLVLDILLLALVIQVVLWIVLPKLLAATRKRFKALLVLAAVALAAAVLLALNRALLRSGRFLALPTERPLTGIARDPGDSTLADRGRVGMVVQRHGDLWSDPDDVVVKAVIQDSPALEAGIESGDVILAIDGVPVKGLSDEKVRERLMGEIGSKVRVTLRARAPHPARRDVTLTRRRMRPNHAP